MILVRLGGNILEKINSRQKQAIETEMKIVKTALSLMKNKGYENTSIREICSAAGISTGAFYHHFKSKEDMINIGFSMYDKYLEDILDTYTETDSLRMLHFVLLNQTEYVIKEGGNLVLELYRALLSSHTQYAIDKDRLYYRTVWKYADQCLREQRINTSLSADYISELLIRVVRGDIIDWCLHEYSYDLMAYIRKDLDVIFKGFSRV